MKGPLSLTTPPTSCFFYQHMVNWNAYFFSTIDRLRVLLSQVSIYITHYSCCRQEWPENRQKEGWFDTWFIHNKLSLPNLSLRQKSNHDKLIWERETQEYGICGWDIKEEHLRNSALIYPLPCDISAWEQ